MRNTQNKTRTVAHVHRICVCVGVCMYKAAPLDVYNLQKISVGVIRTVLAHIVCGRAYWTGLTSDT